MGHKSRFFFSIELVEMHFLDSSTLENPHEFCVSVVIIIITCGQCLAPSQALFVNTVILFQVKVMHLELHKRHGNQLRVNRGNVYVKYS